MTKPTHTHTHTERETDREREREGKREREREREKYTDRDTQTCIHFLHKSTYTSATKLFFRHTTHTHTHTHKQTNKKQRRRIDGREITVHQEIGKKTKKRKINPSIKSINK